MKPILALLCALAFAGCATPTQQAADATFLAGNAFSTFALGQSGQTMKGLQDFVTALPGIPLGKVSPYQLGVLNAELKPLAGAAAANPTGASIYNQIGAAISGLSQLAGANSGASAPTAEQGVLVAEFTDFANGVTAGVQFWQGQQSVTTPATTPPAAAAAAP